MAKRVRTVGDEPTQAALSTVIDAPQQALAVSASDDAPAMMAMIDRYVRDPQVDVAKLEKLVALHERALARTAQEAFNMAMAAAQAEMQPIATDANNPQTHSRYASYYALDKALRPLYAKHGFALSFTTDDAPMAETLRVLCDVMHIGGHSKVYRIDMPADGKGARGGDVMTKTHATGAAASYAMRYLLKMIFNVAVGEDDTDGNLRRRSQPSQNRPVEAPSGSQGDDRKRPNPSTQSDKPRPSSGYVNPIGDLTVTGRKVKRFWDIAKEMHRETKTVETWLKVTYGCRVEQLTNADYDAACAALEAPGSLPIVRRS